MYRMIVAALCVLLLAGCETLNFNMIDQPDPAQLQVQRDAYDQARTKVYYDASVARVLTAAVKIFELSEADYEIIPTANGFVAHRSWTPIPGDGTGEAYWYVAAWPLEHAVVMRVRLAPEPDPNYNLTGQEVLDEQGRALPAPPAALPGDVIDPTQTTLWELARTDGSVGLFFMRMEWVLGHNKYWLYCNAGREYAKIEKWQGGLDAFCRQAGDARPDRMPPIKLPEYGGPQAVLLGWPHGRQGRICAIVGPCSPAAKESALAP